MGRARHTSPAARYEIRLVQGLVWIEARGALSGAAVDELTREVSAFALQHQSRRLLYDFRAAQLGESEVRLYQRVAEAECNDVLRSARVAVVCQVRTPRYAFFESAARRAGHELSVFTDGGLAMAWLGGGQASSA